MHLIEPLADNYSVAYTTPDEPVFKRIYDESLLHPEAQMLSSNVQGVFLEIISASVQPKYILEIGTFTGYSALCLAKGLRKGGELHTIELRDNDANTAWKNIVSANFDNQIRLHRGDARTIIPTLDYNWDIVFIDADKNGYIEYYEMVLPRLSKNGLIIADNVLFHGEVLQENISGKNAKAIAAFNNHVANDERTRQVLLTVRDGLMLIKKI